MRLASILGEKGSVARRLSTRLFGANLIAIGLVSIFILRSHWLEERNQQQKHIENIAKIIAVTIEPAVSRGDKALVSKQLQTALTDPNIIAAKWFGSNGSVLSEVHKLQDVPYASFRVRENIAQQPGIGNVNAGQNIGNQKNIIGQVELSAQYYGFQDGFVWYGWPLMAGLTTAILFGLYVVSRTRKLVLRPLRNMQKKIRQVTQSTDFSGRVEVIGNDEIGDTAAAFNKLLEHLEQREENSFGYQGQLEALVNKRTREVEVANESLQKTVHELEFARDTAEAASRAKSQFLANMSHEIRTPMNAVLGMTELLLASKLQNDQRRLAETVSRSGHALLEILNDILDFSRIEAGKLVLEEADYDLWELVEDTIGLFAERAGSKGLDLTLEIEDDVPDRVRGDSIRLRQILNNLVSNAIKFTEQGGVSIFVSRNAQAANEYALRIDVVDTGIGVSEDSQARIFDAFAQADSSTARRFGGTGLGLAIARQLAELMGGSVALEGKFESGSKFYFTVQLQAPQDKQGVLADLPVLDTAINVLIVESNPRIGGMLRRILLKWQVRCELVTTAGAAALYLANAEKNASATNLVLLDWGLPDSGAAIFAREIQQKVYVVAPKVIAMIPAASVFAKLEISELDIVAKILKPIDRSSLLSALQETCPTTGSGSPVTGEFEGRRLDSARNIRALLVEDNPINQEFASLLLQNLGCSVVLAADGFEALDQVKRGPFDIIFMDCQMPGMDGFEATEKIRIMEANPVLNMQHTPIIALTAHATAGYRELCIAKGMDDYLSKPFNRQKIIEILTRWVEPIASQVLVDQAENAHKMPTHLNRVVEMSFEKQILDSLPTAARFDKSRLEQMSLIKLPGKPDLRQGLLELYFENAPELASQIRIAWQENDLDALYRHSHSLKSASANMGLDHLSKIAAKLEESAKHHHVADIPKAVDALLCEHDWAIATLHAYQATIA